MWLCKRAVRQQSLAKLIDSRFCELIRQAPFSFHSELLLTRSQSTISVTMSFGFSIGDFISVLQFANYTRKQFVDAPSQFKEISDE